MKIVVKEAVLCGIKLADVQFGQVVRRPENNVYYLVISPMDGTGRRDLVTLEAGVLKLVDQDTRVVPVPATLYIGNPCASVCMTCKRDMYEEPPASPSVHEGIRFTTAETDDFESALRAAYRAEGEVGSFERWLVLKHRTLHNKLEDRCSARDQQAHAWSAVYDKMREHNPQAFRTFGSGEQCAIAELDRLYRK